MSHGQMSWTLQIMFSPRSWFKVLKNKKTLTEQLLIKKIAMLLLKTVSQLLNDVIFIHFDKTLFTLATLKNSLNDRL